jgi:hypothetical protein
MKNKITEILTRDTPLSREEWMSLIKARCWEMQSMLDKQTLDSLGRLHLMRTMYSEDKKFLLSDDPTFGGDVPLRVHPLEMQGIFFIGSVESVFYSHRGRYADCLKRNGWSGHKHLGCLTRDGKWAIIRIDFVGIKTKGIEVVGDEKAKHVNITFSSLEDLMATVSLTPKNILDGMNAAVLKWTEAAKGRYDALSSWAERIKSQSHALSYVPTEYADGVTVEPVTSR